MEKANWSDCNGWTGGTCAFSGCEAWRGIDVECSTFKSCACKEGFCNHLNKGFCVREGCQDVEGPSETDETLNKCWEHVEWARTKGIEEHPEWYKYNGTDPTYSDSPMKVTTFQKFIYDYHPELGCPPPCLPRYSVPSQYSELAVKTEVKTEVKPERPASMTEVRMEKANWSDCNGWTGGTCAFSGCEAWRGIDVECSTFKSCACKEGFCNHLNKGFCVREGCQDVEGPSETDETLNKCWEHVEWARTKGIEEHPEWYKYNGTDPTYSDSPMKVTTFQKFIYDYHPELGCPPPCLPRY